MKDQVVQRTTDGARHGPPSARLFGAVVVGLGTIAGVGSLTPTATQGTSTIALVGGMLLDGYDVPPVHHAAVLIEGDRIVWAGQAADARIPAGATLIDTSGRVMLPGLVDLHVHLKNIGHGDYDRWDPWIMERNLLEKVNAISARQLLMAGVTTAVDLGAQVPEILTTRNRIAKGEIPGPRLLVSGPWITRNLGSYQPRPVRQIKVDTPEDAARATEDLIAMGVDVIKAYVGLTPAHYRAITDTAHKHRVRVHAHVYAERDTRNALENGVDVLTHAGSAGTAPPYSQRLIRDIVNSGRPVVITAAHRSWVFPATVEFPERLQDPRLREDFGAEIYAEVQSSFGSFQRLGYMGRIDREVFFRERGLRQFIDSGAVLGMGTDSGTPLNFHTEALWREIKAHVDLGMSPQRAISSATRINARILGKANEVGTIEPGKLADVIVIRGNPLFDIQALANVEVVIKGGVVYKGGAAAGARTTPAQ
jgi:imidazolonepropionase-like amidohydrolase